VRALHGNLGNAGSLDNGDIDLDAHVPSSSGGNNSDTCACDDIFGSGAKGGGFGVTRGEFRAKDHGGGGFLVVGAYVIGVGVLIGGGSIRDKGGGVLHDALSGHCGSTSLGNDNSALGCSGAIRCDILNENSGQCNGGSDWTC
jgi:hypothetical protein